MFHRSLTAFPVDLIVSQAQILRDRRAHCVRRRGTYKARLAGKAPSKLSPDALREGIARTTASIAKLHRLIAELQTP